MDLSRSKNKESGYWMRIEMGLEKLSTGIAVERFLWYAERVTKKFLGSGKEYC